MRFILLTFCCLYVRCLFSQAYVYQTPVAVSDDWQVSHLTDQKIDTSLYHKFFNALPGDNKHKIHSFLLIKNNVLVLEEYFSNNHSTEKHDLRSATKSITSLLVGIALDQGFIQNIDDPIFKYLKGYDQNNPDPRKDRITIRHLLTMSSGLACHDRDKKSPGQEEKMYRKKDWIQYVVDLPTLANPGDTSLYCTGGVVLLGEVISQAAGVRLDTFANRYLFEPLGIKNAQWSYFNQQKKVDAGGHLYLTPRDMGKIGQLILNQGEWRGSRIVSENWIAASTRVHTQVNKTDYAFLWWRISFEVNGSIVQAICARGNGGQCIFVLPSLNLVAVFTGGNYDSPNANLPFEIMNKVVLPSQPEAKN